MGGLPGDGGWGGGEEISHFINMDKETIMTIVKMYQT